MPTIDPLRTTARVGELGPDIAERVRAALEQTARAAPNSRDEDRLWAAILDAARLVRPERGAWIDPAILAREQRVLVEILAHVAGPDFSPFGMPAPAWVRRQWLGIDEGPLFAVRLSGVPVFIALRAAVKRSEEEARAILESLPVVERVPVLAELELAKADYFHMHITELLDAVVPQIGGDLGGWAASFADRLLAIFGDDVPKTERCNAFAPAYEVMRALFAALVRAGVAIEPRWDALLPLSPSMPAEEMHAYVDAIPPARRAAALAAALPRIRFSSDQVAAAALLLPRYPFAEVARHALANLKWSHKPKEVVAVVKRVAKAEPAVAAVLAEHERELAQIPALRVAARERITLEGLDALGRRQLEDANERYGGKRRSVEELFASEEDEQIAASSTERLRIEDESGAHRYDGWLYMGDSGTIFERGTTTVMAEVIQGSVEAPDPKLKLALTDALAARATTKQAKKPRAKKNPSSAKKKKPGSAKKKPGSARKKPGSAKKKRVKRER